MVNRIAAVIFAIALVGMILIASNQAIAEENIDSIPTPTSPLVDECTEINAGCPQVFRQYICRGDQCSNPYFLDVSEWNDERFCRIVVYIVGQEGAYIRQDYGYQCYLDEVDPVMRTCIGFYPDRVSVSSDSPIQSITTSSMHWRPIYIPIVRRKAR